jgi:Na+-driven multidrug efflux pump
MAGFHQCHHILGLEIPTQLNQVLAFGLGILSTFMVGWLQERTPPPVPEEVS